MMRAQRSQILWNVYRQFYDIPKDLFVRKSDPLMRLAVQTSEAFNRADKMRKDGINPSLIFFSHSLTENQIKKCVAILQADDIAAENKVKYFEVLKDIANLLITNSPQLHLMFTSEVDSPKADALPGYFLVPYIFDPSALKTFMLQNLDQARKLAQKFITETVQYDEALEHLATILPSATIGRKAHDQQHMDVERYTLTLK